MHCNGSQRIVNQSPPAMFNIDEKRREGDLHSLIFVSLSVNRLSAKSERCVWMDLVCRSHVHQEGAGQRTRPSQPACQRRHSPRRCRPPRRRTRWTWAFLPSSLNLVEERKRCRRSTLRRKSARRSRQICPSPTQRIFHSISIECPSKPKRSLQQRCPEL